MHRKASSMRTKAQLVTTIDRELSDRIRAMANREERTLAYYVNHALAACYPAQDADDDETSELEKMR
jgi:predicted DNA-binding protein